MADEKKKTRILVTGGAGFIGANFIFYLLDNYPDAQIICLDALTYAGHRQTLAKAMNLSRFRFYKADIRNRAEIEAVFNREKPEVVVNLAAETHVDRSIADPAVFTETNVLGTDVLLKCSVEHGTRHFHQVSTDEVYGDFLPEGNNSLCDEEAPLRPSSPYAASKAAGDLLAKAYHRTYGLNVSISRCSNNYGPYQFPEKLIPKMIVNALNGDRLALYGDGRHIRDWLYVDDHCRALALIITGQPRHDIYNIAGHQEKANIDIVKTILRKLERPENLIAFVKDRPGHDRGYAMSCARCEAEFGFKPAITLEEGLARTVRWYIDNQAWCSQVTAEADEMRL